MMVLPRFSWRRLQRGFTLLEILVVMALLSLIMLAMGASLSGVAQSISRTDQRLAVMDDYRMAASWLRSSLGRVSARKMSTSVPAGASPFLFVGTESSVEWVGVMPARFGAGGRYFFRLGLEETAEGGALVIRFQPWADVSEFPNWSQAESRVLLRGVLRIGLQYENDRVDPAVWSPEWSETRFLPSRAAVTLQTADGKRKDLVLALYVLPASDALGQGDGTVVGGTPVQ